MLIGLYVLNLGYAFEGTATRLKDFRFVSDLFTGHQPTMQSPEADKGLLNHARINEANSGDQINRFSSSLFGRLPVPLPKDYLLGIDTQQKDFENYRGKSYLRGEWSDHGWWYYYIYAALIKVPLGLWSLGILTLSLNFVQKKTSYKSVLKCLPSRKWERKLLNCFPPDGAATERISPFRDTIVLLAPPLIIFAVASGKAGFSEHFRYVLPCFPFVFVWLSQAARYFLLPPNPLHLRA
jgi:hypothetical protein